MHDKAGRLRMKIIFGLTLAVITAISCSGCDPKNTRDSSPDAEYVTPKVEYIDEAGIAKLASNRNGKALLLNVWATWCPPCVEEFPDLVKISKIFKNDNCEFVGISADDPDDINSKVIPFLKKYKVPFKIYIAKIDNEEKFINALNGSWNGAIPATFIYDSTGKQRYFSIGMKTYEQFEKEIEKIR
jgi:thiol-disulfide isomerase/thioredoxin